MTLFNPYVLLSIFLAVIGSYGAGRLQQKVSDGAVYQKKVDAMVAAADAAKHAEEQRRAQEAVAAEAAAAAKEKERARQMALAQSRIASLSADLAATRVASVGGLLNRSIGEQSLFAGPAAKPGEKAAAPAAGDDTTVGDWARWSVAVIDLYHACSDQVIGLQDFYARIKGMH